MFAAIDRVHGAERSGDAGGDFRLHGPQNADCFRLPLLLVIGVSLVAVHRAIILADPIVHHLGVVHAARGHARRVNEPVFRIDADAAIRLAGSQLTK